MRVLIIEDNADLAASIYDALEVRGYQADWAQDGPMGLRMLAEARFDLVILDLGLPKLDGLEVCRRLRSELELDTPVLMLTARDRIDDKLQGFEVGTDDYLVKPFELDELEARIQALLRRSGRTQTVSRELSIGDLRLDPEQHEVRRGETRLSLEPIPFRILEHLMRNKGRVVPRDELVDTVWGDDPPDADVLKVHISRLRAVVDKPFGTETIETVPKVGFRVVD